MKYHGCDFELKVEQYKAKQAQVLLPCPFCGSLPEWINEAKADGHYYIRCPECKIVMVQDRRDKVIGYWNRRTEKLKQ